MPNIIGGNTIVFDKDDWLGGLHPQYLGGTAVMLPVIGSQLSGATSFNPYRKLGYAMPGYEARDPDNNSAVTTYLKKGVISGQEIYITENSANLQKVTIGLFEPSVVDDATWPYAITAHGGASDPVADDCVVYYANQSGVRTKMLFYSWSDNTSWDIGAYDFDSTFDDDYMQTVPASPLDSPYAEDGQGYAHPLIVGDDDILYIGDRNYLHAYDGYTGANGTFEEAVMTLPAGYVIKSMARISGHLVVFAYLETSVGNQGYYYGSVKAFFYNYLDQDPVHVYELNDNYVGEAFEFRGTVGVFTQGRTNDLENQGNRASRIQLFTDFVGGFEEVTTFDKKIPERGGVTVSGSFIMWNSEGTLFTYGAPFADMEPRLNKIAQGATAGTVSGLLMSPTTNFLLMSSSTLAGGRIQYFRSGNYATGDVTTCMASPRFKEGMRGEVKEVRVFYGGTSASTGRQLRLALIDSSGSVTTVFDPSTDSATVTQDTLVKKFDDVEMRFDAVKVYLEWGNGANTSAPIVQRIEITFEETKIID